MPPKTKTAPVPKPSAMMLLRTDMEKRWGSRVTTQVSRRERTIVSTGILHLDLKTRIGGLPLGYIVQFIGQKDMGKTTAALRVASEAQKAFPSRLIGFIDMEHKFDEQWAIDQGVDTDEERFLHVYPDHAEDVSDQAKKMLDTGLFSVIIIDSIGGMESEKGFEKEAGESAMGKNAQIIARLTKRCSVYASNNNTLIIAINQLRADIGNARGGEKGAGGKTFEYGTAMDLNFMGSGEPPLKMGSGDDAVIVGRHYRIKVTRNKFAPAGGVGGAYIINDPTEKYGPVGVKVSHDVLVAGIESGAIEQAGAWYTLPNGERFQGKEKLTEYVQSHPETVQQVREAMLTRAVKVYEDTTEIETSSADEPDEAGEDQ